MSMRVSQTSSSPIMNGSVYDDHSHLEEELAVEKEQAEEEKTESVEEERLETEVINETEFFDENHAR